MNNYLVFIPYLIGVLVAFLLIRKRISKQSLWFKVIVIVLSALIIGFILHILSAIVLLYTIGIDGNSL
jgi:hypothetical protein